MTFINDNNDKSLDEDNDDIRFYKCPKCGSYHIVKNGTYARKTTVINEEVVITKIQKYICKKCNTSFKYLPLYLSMFEDKLLGNIGIDTIYPFLI